jgi:hypothetical protein
MTAIRFPLLLRRGGLDRLIRSIASGVHHQGWLRLGRFGGPFATAASQPPAALLSGAFPLPALSSPQPSFLAVSGKSERHEVVLAAEGAFVALT